MNHLTKDSSFPYLQGKNIGSDTVAALAVGVHEVKNAVNIPVGVECHMNGADHALACAVASSAKWVRVFEWCNAFISQSGYIEAIGGKLARDRSRLHAGEIAFLCDVHLLLTPPQYLNQYFSLVSMEYPTYFLLELHPHHKLLIFLLHLLQFL